MISVTDLGKGSNNNIIMRMVNAIGHIELRAAQH
jgi:hypothetical protein